MYVLCLKIYNSNGVSREILATLPAELPRHIISSNPIM